MPNWCRNKLRVTGPLKEVARFVRENRGKGSRLTFESLLPTPESMLRDHREIGEMADVMKEILGITPPKDWWSWRILKWGTKWDVDGATIKRVANKVTYTFGTAWSPPIPWVAEASKRYPLLEFDLRYCETGCDFSGSAVFQRGEAIEQSDGSAADVRPEDEFDT